MLKSLMVPLVAGMLLLPSEGRTVPRRDDGAILAAMALRDSTEIQLGQLAIDKGQSAGVKAYGRMLMRDHTAHLAEVRALAGKLGVPVTAEAQSAEMREDNAAALRKIGETGVNEFDATFLDFAYEAHAAAIIQTNDEHLPTAQNASVKALLQKTLGSLRNHLAGAKRLLPPNRPLESR